MAKKERKKKPKSVMHTDIKDLEVSRALRRLGRVRVTEWEFSDVLPMVKGIAATEVDVLDFFKRTANYRVNDWQFRPSEQNDPGPKPRYQIPTQEEAKKTIGSLTSFLRFVSHSLIQDTDQATIMVGTPSPSEIRFRLILTQRDSAALIGHGGHTAAAIRNLMKDAGTRSRFFVDLKIISIEEHHIGKQAATCAPNRKNG